MIVTRRLVLKGVLLAAASASAGIAAGRAAGMPQVSMIVYDSRLPQSLFHPLR